MAEFHSGVRSCGQLQAASQPVRSPQPAGAINQPRCTNILTTSNRFLYEATRSTHNVDRPANDTDCASIFELSQLRCFVAVAEEQHFRRAAARLNMSQPPLSRQIQHLEHELEVALVDRTTRVVRLTAAGRMFLLEAKRILRLSEDAKLAAKRVARGDGGTMTLAFIPAASYAVLPRLVSFTSGEMPHVSIILKEMVTADQVDALLATRIDIGILRMPIDRRGLETVCVRRDQFMVAFSTAHRFASIGHELSIGDLDREAFIMYAPIESRYHYDLV